MTDNNYYDKLINKFNRGGAAKLEASHELIMSVYDYIYYLTDRYFKYIKLYYMSDALSFCHVYLLKQIYKFNPKKGRFITWARYRIINGLAIYYERKIAVVKLPRHAESLGIRVKSINIGVLVLPNTLNFEKIDHDIDFERIVNKLHTAILDKFGLRDWLLFSDYFGLKNCESKTLPELRNIYGYNTNQAGYAHITKIINYIKSQPELINLIGDLRQ